MTLSNRSKRITIKEVAETAGVSMQTVSRVMNNFSYVSGETRQRVEAAVQQLGYRPSTLARSLSQRRSYTLGVVTFGLKYMGPSRTLNGIADKADELGYTILMKEIDYFDSKRIDDVLDSLLSRQVDGILWAAPEIGGSHVWLTKSIEKITAPVLFLTTQPRAGFAAVLMDNYQGAVTATQYLLDCGRKKIGHISGPMDWWDSQERKRGWNETLKAAGFEVSEQHSVEGNWSSASGEQAFDQLLDSYPDMDAIFVANDQMALSVLSGALSRGIRIPEQLAVVGFDGIPESAYFYPSLTTISQDLPALGEQAVQIIVEMIQAQHENRSYVKQSRFLQPTLVVRKSS